MLPWRKMSRNIRPYAIHLRSRRSRRSLTSIGIRDHRDALAMYFRWVRQRYYIAQGNMEPELPLPAESVAATCDVLDGHRGHDVAAPVGVQFDTERLSVELMGVGASFDDEPSYPGELDLLG
ncbi:hypothetical protein GMOD_00003511 [Pyrenophora seminiperda CCB06]|uniref:Uncharacterized protein n=1 Tax=Pyrenophora seminiperda CCB06 TaxID=1302712 RepID=A0A3M7MIV1_9PLEO|nr:hypothetical protein GMOD_00003511 [Pyrenophora seminiperda CCB06]